MCGIVGFIDFHKKLKVKDLETLINTLSHRGPDDNGNFFINTQTSNIGIGHTRLTILDPSKRGKQPMNFEDLIISFNGEIYNFEEIRDLLIKQGYKFETKTDTEVLLKAYHFWGLKFVDKINGMYAISILDRGRNKLYLIRDRVGVKPIYWSFENENFVFSSEIKIFKKSFLGKYKISHKGICNYFQYGYIPEPHSILEGVQKLKAGHFLEFNFDEKKLSTQDYWDCKPNKEDHRQKYSEHELIKKLDNLINDSVKLRMVSDFPVGIFLSGGYDSSLVASYMCRLSDKQVESFTIGFENKSVDESHYAKKIANFLDTKHHEYKIKNSDILNILNNYNNLYDEPIGDPAILPTAFLSKETKNKVKVVQSADGGDELFAGYDKYRKIINRNKKSKMIPKILKKIVKEIRFKKVSLFEKKNFKTIYKYCKNENLIDWFLDDSTAHDYFELKNLLKYPKLSQTNFHLNTENKDDLNSMLYLDIKTFLVDGIMHKVDRATMYSGLEAREPLLDHKLIEFALKIPECLKLKNGELKYLLKTLAHSKLPKNLLQRPKQGFNIPIVDFTLIIFKEHKDTFLSETQINTQNIFNYEEIKKLKKEIEDKDYNRIGTVWLLVMFQIWYYGFFTN